MALTTLANKHFNLNTSLILTDGNNNPLTYDWQLYGETRDGVLRIEHFKIQNNTVIYYDHFDGDTVVYQNGAWVNDDYRYINIEQGADVETSSALSWFDTNAVEIIFNFPISYNLTGLTAYGENIGDTRPTIISEDTDVYITLVPDTDYGLPANITVEGCDYSYNNTYGTITLSNPYANVTLTAVGTFHKVYTIEMNLSHVTYIGDATVETDGTSMGTLYADVGYFLPDTVTVRGCSYTYSKATGAITFSNPPHSTTSVSLTVVGSEIDTTDLTLVLYNNLSERNRVMKTITLIGTLTGTLREESSMFKPTVTIEYNKVPDFNYVQIPNYKRYYYVDNVVSVRKNIWRLELSVDVLMSFYLLIANLQCFVTRNEYDYNSLIVDNKLPSTNKDIKTIIDIDNSPYLVPDLKIGRTLYSYVLSTVTETTHTNTIGNSVPWNSGTWDNDKMQRSFVSNCKMNMDASGVETLLEQLNNPNFATKVENFFKNAPLEAIISLRAYPFEVDKITNSTSVALERIKIGGYEMGLTLAKYISSYCDKYASSVNGGYFTFTNTSNYTWKDIKSQYDLYIPFYGFTEIDFNDVIGKVLHIYYIVDFDTGNCTIILETTKIIKLIPSKIGIDIPLSATNSQEITRQVAQTVLNTYASAMATSIGVGSGNPLALAGGVVSGVKTLSSSLDIHQKYYRQSSSGGSYENTFMPLTPYIIKTTPDYYTPTNYAHLFGYPLNETRVLSNVHGYTEVGEVHLEYLSGVMVEECAEIGRLLQEGVILP